MNAAPLTQDDLVALAKAYANASRRLEDKVDAIREEQRKAVRAQLRWMRPLVAAQSAAREALEVAVQASPHLFVKPRTRAVDGVKYGLRKKPGRMAIDDEATAIARLRKRLGAEAEGHVRTRESLVRDGVRDLDARLLAHCGIALVDSTDEVVIRIPRDDLDMLVDALMDGIEEDAT